MVIISEVLEVKIFTHFLETYMKLVPASGYASKSHSEVLCLRPHSRRIIFHLTSVCFILLNFIFFFFFLLCLHLSVYYKGYNRGTAKQKRCIGQDMGGGEGQSFHALSGHPTLPAHQCVHQPRSSLKPGIMRLL